MKLRNKHAKHANIKLNLPIVGEIQLKDGIVEVSKEVHDLMIGDGLNEWMTGEEVDEEEAETDLNIKNDYKAMVDGLSFEEVCQLAKEANIPNWTRFQKNEKALRTYVTNKLRDADEDARLEAEAKKALEMSGESHPEDEKGEGGSPLDNM